MDVPTTRSLWVHPIMTVGLAAATLLAVSCGSSPLKNQDAGANQTREAGPMQGQDAGDVRGQGGLFSVCLGPQDCAPGLICACGAICTIPCRVGLDTCGELDAGAMCPQAVPQTADCDPGRGGCVRSCLNDDACWPLGPSAACLGGSCKFPQAITLRDGSAPSCDDRLAPLRAQVAPAVASADRTCRLDSDCVNVSASNRCYGLGCPLTYVTREAGGKLDALLASLDAQYCEAILRSGCVLPAGPHSCPRIAAPACMNGQCGQSQPTLIQPDAEAD